MDFRAVEETPIWKNIEKKIIYYINKSKNILKENKHYRLHEILHIIKIIKLI